MPVLVGGVAGAGAVVACAAAAESESLIVVGQWASVCYSGGCRRCRYQQVTETGGMNHRRRSAAGAAAGAGPVAVAVAVEV